MKKRELGSLLALVAMYVFLLAVLSFTHIPASPAAAAKAPGDSLTAQNFASAVAQLHTIESENEDLQAKVSKLQDKVGETYPSEIEKETADLSSIATFLAIALTLAALFVSLITFQKFQDTLRDSGRREAISIVKSRSDFLQGRFNLAIGFVLGKAAWNSREAYKPTPLNYLADISEVYLESAYSYSEKETVTEFKSEMETLNIFALNNLIFYATLNPQSIHRLDIAKYLLKLEKVPNFEKNGLWINTYCRGALTFLPAFAKEKKITTREVLFEVERLCDLQKRHALNPDSRREVARIWRLLRKEQRNPANQ